MFLENFHLMRPFWLFSSLPILIMLIWFWRRNNQCERVWKNICDSHLFPHLSVDLGQWQKYTIMLLLGFGWLFSILALVGPTWSKQPQVMFSSQPARVLILDLSKSMDAENRLDHAKIKIKKILERSQTSQTALLVFAGDVHVVSPLTMDVKFIHSMLRALNTDMPASGKQTHLALRKAVKLLEQANINQGQIILITDGLNNEQADISIENIMLGHQLSVLAINVTENSSQLLRNLAKTGKGIYTKLTVDNTDINTLLKTNFWTETMNHEDWQERGYLFLLPLLLLAAFSFRRGWLFGLLICVVVSPQKSYALNWDDLWLRPNQQIATKLNEGVVYYRSGKYELAVDIFKQLETSKAYYNLGNTLVKLDKLKEAETAYRNVLEKNPEHLEAQHNLKIIQKQLQQTKVPKELSPEPQNTQEDTEESSKGLKGINDSNEGKMDSSSDPSTGQKTILKGDSVDGRPPDNSQQEHSQEIVELTMEQWLQRISDKPSELWIKKLEHQQQIK
jgi:Ca-activated chloride channel family protein